MVVMAVSVMLDVIAVVGIMESGMGVAVVVVIG